MGDNEALKKWGKEAGAAFVGGVPGATATGWMRTGGIEKWGGKLFGTTPAKIDDIDYDPYGGAGGATANLLAARAQGQAPSEAAAIARGAQERQFRGDLGAAHAGNNPALARRAAMHAGAQAAIDITGKGAMGRAGEMAAARQQHSQFLSGAEARQLEARKIENEARVQAELDAQANKRKMWGTVAKIGSMISDERAKENVADAKQEMYDFLDNLSAHEYDYKEPEKHGKGRQFSVMAQQLEKSKVGKKFVDNRSDGLKEVNYGRGLAAMLASQSELHKRLKKLED